MAENLRFLLARQRIVQKRLDDIVIDLINNEWPDYELTDTISSEIPESRRARKNCKGSVAESLLIFEYK